MIKIDISYFFIYIYNGDINMKRKIYEDLLEWKNDFLNVKPLMILGARQVGKTYIINEFCKNEYENYISVNLLQDIEIVNLYKRIDLNSEQKFNYLQTIINFDLSKENTILFIDEIQCSEELISELKFFCEKHNNIRIICAGSLLGVKLKRFHSSFPVGKVKMIKMYPMDFKEFLLANKKEMLINEIENCYKNNQFMVEPLHNQALEYYKYYLICGGMPESVKNFIGNNCDIMKYDSTIKQNIIDSYFKDMKSYVSNDYESLKIERIYRSIPNQISNESKKFQFSKVEKNGRSREYLLPLDWLNASNMILPSYKATLPEKPLAGFVDYDNFKLFINDVGLLNHLLEVKYKDILEDDLSLFKGSITENYVATQFAYNNISLYYWLSSGIAEIDFLLYNDDGIIPVEVKAAKNTQSKSLSMYIDSFNPKYSIRISTKNFGFDNEKKIKSIPLYAIFCIKDN